MGSSQVIVGGSGQIVYPPLYVSPPPPLHSHHLHRHTFQDRLTCMLIVVRSTPPPLTLSLPLSCLYSLPLRKQSLGETHDSTIILTYVLATGSR